VDFLVKYVWPDQLHGCYLPELSGGKPVWNWRPGRDRTVLRVGDVLPAVSRSTPA
jgi:hypothetical protein